MIRGSAVHSEVRETVDYLAAGIAGASFLEIVPAIAAVFSIAWMGIRIYELTTGEEFSKSKLAQLLTRLPPRK